MAYRKIIEDYYNDTNNLTDYLSKLVNSYRLLVGAAGELNDIALAHKKEVRKAINTSNDLLNVIDEVIDVLEKTSFGYMDYCKIKGKIMQSTMQVQYIQTEIDNELKLQNSEKGASDNSGDVIDTEREVFNTQKDMPINEKDTDNSEEDGSNNGKDAVSNEEDTSSSEKNINNNGKEV
ncbi:hypothetical protein HBE96_02045 [Clostridium sp. P21]|uniref:Uncharacterized protein n=1 Tax=Clostridium muellerianum TaxID=2716538 RepID=A0A7Y0HL32_9CLOT|nr:hypothetical protein [Clostridium muellerianum]NMM61499.1 hypothetical protein [Clostridium muellerianum]